MAPLATLLTGTFARLASGITYTNFFKGHVKAGKENKIDENTPSVD